MKPIAILMSRFHEENNHGLLEGACNYLKEQNIFFSDTHLFTAPGAFEIPLIAQKLAQTGHFSGIIALGCIIKGETLHFEFISLAATLGILQGMLKTEIPVSFGILTCATQSQSYTRSAKNAQNKGRQAAAACLESIATLEKIKSISK